MGTVKLLHIACAYITGAGFLLRGLLAIAQNPLQQHQLTRTLPHIVDTVLFLTGLVMVVSWSLSPTSQPWLAAKLLALLAYIGCGFLMLRWGNSDARRISGLLGGLAIYGYIVGVAHSKSTLSFAAFL